MPKSRIERAKESYEREQHKADIRRLKKAYEYFDIALAALTMPFNGPTNADVAGELENALSVPMAKLRGMIEKG